MKKEKQQREQNYQIRKSSGRLERKKITFTWEYWKQTPSNRDERKSKKRLLQKNEKTSRKQTIQQKSHQRNKYLDSLFCNILWTIFQIDKEGTQINGTKDKEIDDNAHRRWHKQTVWIMKIRKKRTSWYRGIRVCNNSRIRGIHKRKEQERLIRAAKNSNVKTRTISKTKNLENKNKNKNNCIDTSEKLGKLHSRRSPHGKKRKWIFFNNRLK